MIRIIERPYEGEDIIESDQGNGWMVTHWSLGKGDSHSWIGGLESREDAVEVGKMLALVSESASYGYSEDR